MTIMTRSIKLLGISWKIKSEVSIYIALADLIRECQHICIRRMRRSRRETRPIRDGCPPGRICQTLTTSMTNPLKICIQLEICMKQVKLSTTGINWAQPELPPSEKHLDQNIKWAMENPRKAGIPRRRRGRQVKVIH